MLSFLLNGKKFKVNYVTIFFLKKIHWVSRCSRTSPLGGQPLSIIPTSLMIKKRVQEARIMNTKRARDKPKTPKES